MSETWKCGCCGETVLDSYVECWSCQTPRPGYATPAEQVMEWRQQMDISRDLQNEQVREWRQQMDVSRDLLNEQIREQNRQQKVAEEFFELQRINEARISALLDRWEKLTSAIEAKQNPQP